MKNTETNPMKVTFHRHLKEEGSDYNTFSGLLIQEDHESCIVELDYEGTPATIVLFHDEWNVIKLY